MERGTYVAASGGLLQFRKLEVVNNNLANVNTPGFKKIVLTGEQQTFDQTLASIVSKNDPYAKGDHDRTPGTVTIHSAVDFSPGPIKPTGNPYDVALRDPNDFFVVQTPQGTQYTRAGNFTLNNAGELVTQDGMRVVGDGGPITITGTNVSITDAGVIRAGPQSLGTLQVAHFADPQGLEPVGGTRFKLRAGQTAPSTVDPNLISGSLEMANVSAISSTIDLITTSRAFELYTKTAQSIDQMNQQAISEIGKRS